jgi:hypothetical protein
MKTTLTEKLDNYLESTLGGISLIATIGVFIGSLFALSIAYDYNIGTPTAFGVVFFLVVFGTILGGLGAYIVTEKIGYANSAQVSRSLHKHYNSELEKVQAENLALVADLANARERLADYGCDLVEHDKADKYADKLHTLTNAVYHFGYAMVEDSDLLNGAWDTLRGIDEAELTDTAKAQAFADYVVFIYSDEPEFTITTPANYRIAPIG